MSRSPSIEGLLRDCENYSLFNAVLPRVFVLEDVFPDGVGGEGPYPGCIKVPGGGYVKPHDEL
jgi:hypothetical protein